MRRLSLALLPFLAAFALIFGLYHLYFAVQLVRSGQAIQGALMLVFGAVGVALAVGIWVARRRARAQPTADPSGKPPA